MLVRIKSIWNAKSSSWKEVHLNPLSCVLCVLIDFITRPRGPHCSPVSSDSTTLLILAWWTSLKCNSMMNHYGIAQRSSQSFSECKWQRERESIINRWVNPESGFQITYPDYMETEVQVNTSVNLIRRRSPLPVWPHKPYTVSYVMPVHFSDTLKALYRRSADTLQCCSAERWLAGQGPDALRIGYSPLLMPLLIIQIRLINLGLAILKCPNQIMALCRWLWIIIANHDGYEL